MPRDPARMPAVFFGHGSPMNALAKNRHTETWRTLGEKAGKPKAILMADARLSAPTPEHHLPLLYVLGARRDGEPIEVVGGGIQMGSISMLSAAIGA